MALWQITLNDVTQEETFDDGLAFKPGDEGFTNQLVHTHCQSLGAGYSFNYMGTPNWTAPVEALVEEE